MGRADVDKFLRRCPRCENWAAMPMSVRGWNHSLAFACATCFGCGLVVGGELLLPADTEPSPSEPEAVSPPPEQREAVLTYSL
jgi:hypothetical protein